MTGADTAMAAIRGGTAAQRVLHEIGAGHAPPDALFDALQAELELRDDDRTKSFCRQIQKWLERQG